MLVACGKSDNIIIIDPNNLEKVSEIPSKGMPWGIVTFPKATGSLD
jgi:YVTN family beta-propeller protein